MQKNGATGGKIKSSCAPHPLLLGYKPLPRQGRRQTLPVPSPTARRPLSPRCLLVVLSNISIASSTCKEKGSDQIIVLPRASFDTFAQTFPGLPRLEGIKIKPPISKKAKGCAHTSGTTTRHFPGHHQHGSPPAQGRCC